MKNYLLSFLLALTGCCTNTYKKNMNTTKNIDPSMEVAQKPMTCKITSLE